MEVEDNRGEEIENSCGVSEAARPGEAGSVARYARNANSVIFCNCLASAQSQLILIHTRQGHHGHTIYTQTILKCPFSGCWNLYFLGENSIWKTGILWQSARIKTVKVPVCLKESPLYFHFKHTLLQCNEWIYWHIQIIKFYRIFTPYLNEHFQINHWLTILKNL